eukprot:COSAG02_NODE_7403_length_3033_cov_3.831970_3_plen_135_part_00
MPLARASLESTQVLEMSMNIHVLENINELRCVPLARASPESTQVLELSMNVDYLHNATKFQLHCLKWSHLWDHRDVESALFSGSTLQPPSMLLQRWASVASAGAAEPIRVRDVVESWFTAERVAGILAAVAQKK